MWNHLYVIQHRGVTFFLNEQPVAARPLLNGLSYPHRLDRLLLSYKLPVCMWYFMHESILFHKFLSVPGPASDAEDNYSFIVFLVSGKSNPHH